MRKTEEDITFGQLRTFACVAETGSFAAAAERLGISQPAVSEQIGTLERRLGRTLFRRRRGSKSMLTDEGEMARGIVVSLLAASERLYASRDEDGRERIDVRICIGPMLREVYLKPLIPAIYADHPNVEIELTPVYPVQEAMDRLDRGEIDLLVYTITEYAGDWPNTRKLADVPVVLAAPVGTRERLASGSCTLADLRFLFPVRREMGERLAVRCLRKLGVTPHRPPEFIEFADVIGNMVENGQGVGYLMVESVVDQIAAGRIEALDLPVPPMHRIVARSPHAPDVVRDIEGRLCAELA